MVENNTERKIDWKEKLSACWLSAVPNISRQKKQMLLKTVGSASNALLCKQGDLCGILDFQDIIQWQNFEKEKSPYQIWEELKQKEIQFISYYENGFPQKLREIPDPPIGIYYIGKLPDENQPMIAMIGARRCSEYGRCMAEHFAGKLAKNGIGVVSGMAIGIDSVSQRAAIKHSGKSYGILGCGVDVIYPPSNRDLYMQLIQQGGVISEYPPQTPALPFLFPERNRIISGLSDAVLVIEAKEKSGTLITVDMALEQGKEVFAIPGRCTDSLSFGCNKLLRQGAVAVIKPEDILEDMKWSKEEKKYSNTVRKIPEYLSVCAKEIIQVLDVLPCTQDEVMTELSKKGKNYSVPEVCNALLELELSALVRRTYGQYSLTLLKI